MEYVCKFVNVRKFVTSKRSSFEVRANFITKLWSSSDEVGAILLGVVHTKLGQFLKWTMGNIRLSATAYGLHTS